jgi:diguanylate cyclase (GGDEF)-like protein/PAS domain S-box-containing protein
MRAEHTQPRPDPTPVVATSIDRRLVQPVVVLVALIIGLAAVTLVGSARHLDEQAAARQRGLAAGVLAAAERSVGKTVRDYAWWDEAVEALHGPVDRPWADENLAGEYARENFGFAFGFAIAPDGRTSYLARDGEPVEADVGDMFAGGLDRLVAEARRVANVPYPAVGLLRSEDGWALVGVSALMDEDSEVGGEIPLADVDVPRTDLSVLGFGQILDPPAVARLGERFGLADLQLVGPGTAEADRLELTAPDGSAIGAFLWQADRPGQMVLQRLTPPFAAAFAVVVVLSTLLLARVRATALALQASEARFRDVAESASDWIWETDARLALTYVSERFAEVTGQAPAAVLGAPPDALFRDRADADGATALRRALEQKRAFRDLRCSYVDGRGHARHCRLAGRPTLAPDGSFLGFRGTATDTTAEVEALEQARHHALHDPLTGLPNRRLLAERLDRALALARREQGLVAVLCLDLDHFKGVNDTLGHRVGDRLLCAATERLAGLVRETDTVARVGGDEFTIVQIGATQPLDAEALCRRLIEDLSAPFVVEGEEVSIGISIGVAIADPDGPTADAVLQHADIALYRAKQDGRGTFRFFEPEMDAALQRRKTIERELRHALRAEELEVFYQPLVDIESGRVTSVEALVRWQHPVRGLVGPSEFVPIAEEIGLIVPLGEWVLRTACRQALRWPELKLAVNLSVTQVRQPDLIEIVAAVLAETGLTPERLELEITESVLLHDTAHAIAVIDGLRRLGVTVAMDDFGTGYSSLSYLQRFAFGKIKIDRSFVSQIGADPEAAAIVRAVLGLGRSLSLRTSAEGVETAGQLAFLRAEGCQEAQGFLFSRPVPAAAIDLCLAAQDGGARLGILTTG